MAKELKLPQAEYVAGNVDYPEMVKKDFRKAVMILILTVLSTAAIVAGLYLILLYF